MRSSRIFSLLAAVPVLFAAASAHAIPLLQFYIEGGTYDFTTESWTPPDAESFDIWVIGYTGKGDLLDVRLSIAVDSSETGSIMLTPTTTGVVSDASTPVAPVLLGQSADGALPVMSDGKTLPPHGTFGPGTSFFEYGLGDFTLADSECGDFIGAFPTTLDKTCQINVYTVKIDGYENVQFDAYASTDDGKSTFAPFSHDAGGVPAVPEPSSALLFGLGALLVRQRTVRQRSRR